MEEIVIFGASGHARVVADIIIRSGMYKIAGFIDSILEAGDLFHGYPVLGSEEVLPELAAQQALTQGIIAIGDNWKREIVSDKVIGLIPNFTFVNAIHPTALVDSTLGQGIVAMAGVIANPGTVIGSHCILNTGSILDHDTKMENFSSIAPGVTIGGNCRLGYGSAVSIGATVIHGIDIGEHAIVGAGAVVVRDVPSLTVSYGNPSRVVRGRNAGDRYL